MIQDDEATSMGLPRYPCPAMAALEWGFYVYEQYVLQRASKEIPGNTALGERLFIVDITEDDNDRLDKLVPGGVSGSSVAIVISVTDSTLDAWEATQDSLDRLYRLSEVMQYVQTV